jgi:hypothetical protein
MRRAAEMTTVQTATVEEIYQQYIKPLPASERLRLLAITAQDLAGQRIDTVEGPKRSIMELHGLGAEIWNGVDAQNYVDKLRGEWDHRP